MTPLDRNQAKQIRQLRTALDRQCNFLDKVRLGWNLDEKDCKAISHEQLQILAVLEATGK